MDAWDLVMRALSHYWRVTRQDMLVAQALLLGPNVASSGDVVELRGDAHAVATLAHTALNDIADAELLGDLLYMDGLALVDE
jgi:hypothetical protein